MIRLASQILAVSLLAACSATIGQDIPGGGGGGGNGGGGGGGGTDAACPDVHFMATKTTPYVQLLIDRSGSMSTNLNGTQTSRYQSVHDALVGSSGVVNQLQGQVYFGASLFTDDANPTCPTLYSQPRALNNFSTIKTLIESQQPGGATPTAKSIDQVVADFAAHPAPMGGTPVIVLATDGLPNDCNSSNDTSAEAVASTKAAYTAGIRTYIIGIAGVADQFLQDVANAGTGVQTGQPNAMYYTSNSPAQMTAAFQQIIGGVLSCDLQLSGTVDTSQASSGTVTLNGMPLQYGTDWTLVNGNTL
jgi:hypothetical protein